MTLTTLTTWVTRDSKFFLDHPNPPYHKSILPSETPPQRRDAPIEYPDRRGLAHGSVNSRPPRVAAVPRAALFAVAAPAAVAAGVRVVPLSCLFRSMPPHV
eukprot:2882945-Prymnesium_polylepis.1